MSFIPNIALPLSARRDPPLLEPRTRVKLKLRKGAHCICPRSVEAMDHNAHPLFAKEDGQEFELLVFQSEMSDVHNRYEDNPQGLEMAIAAYNASKAAWDQEQETLADRRERATGERGKPEPYRGSVEAEFMKMFRRTQRPIISYEILEEGLPPPESAAQLQQRAQTEYLTNLVATAVGETLKHHGPNQRSKR